MQRIAQVSLEFLLVMACALSILLIIVPMVIGISARSFHSNELARTRLFASNLKFALRKLTALSEGSELSLQCTPTTEWTVAFNSNTFLVSSGGTTFSYKAPLKFIGAKKFTVSKHACFRLKRLHDSINVSVEDC